jgi:hypothetical protein
MIAAGGAVCLAAAEVGGTVGASVLGSLIALTVWLEVAS